ncbi:MAG: hypothetical protein BGO76_00200 [Caedibacter sp. 38-128]|nr:MAG: hypothetical protein BGO76_00200 [Caedibacter sp. 38-128]
MRNLMNTSLLALSYLASSNLSHASNTDLTDESFFTTACIYSYKDNQEEESLDFNLKCFNNINAELEKFGPIHVNLIDRQLTDEVLDLLLPYASSIYALSLADNFFTNTAIEKLSEFTGLRYLDVANNSFTSPSLKPLTKLKNLKHLILTYNRIEPLEFENLKESRPDITIKN